MNRQHTIIFILLTLLLASCGDDRSSEYYALTADNRWINQTMQKYYLWNDDLPEIEEKEYFGSPEDFIKKIVSKKALGGKGDKFTYIEDHRETDQQPTRGNIDEESTYGIDFELLTDPTGETTHKLARILYTLPHSPASEAGLKRGDWISEMDGERITVNNYRQLRSGGPVTLTREKLIETEEETKWQEAGKIQMQASRPMADNPFLLDSVYNIQGTKAAYLMYTGFRRKDGQYAKEMEQIFSRMKQLKPQIMILDLRYNSGGYLSAASQLAAMTAPADAIGQPLYTLRYNKTSERESQTGIIDPKWKDYNIGAKTLYIITTGRTASASEMIINCLRPYYNEKLITVGQQTYGKPVAMEPYTNEAGTLILWPVTSIIYNKLGKADYAGGIPADIKAVEPNNLQPLGSSDDPMLRAIIDDINPKHN